MPLPVVLAAAVVLDVSVEGAAVDAGAGVDADDAVAEAAASVCVSGSSGERVSE